MAIQAVDSRSRLVICLRVMNELAANQWLELDTWAQHLDWHQYLHFCSIGTFNHRVCSCFWYQTSGLLWAIVSYSRLLTVALLYCHLFALLENEKRLLSTTILQLPTTFEAAITLIALFGQGRCFAKITNSNLIYYSSKVKSFGSLQDRFWSFWVRVAIFWRLF